MGSILSIVASVATVVILVLWIMSIIKAFKGGSIVWGILNIFFGLIGLGMIYFFVKGPKQLGIYWLIALIVSIVASFMGGASFLPANIMPG